jgi:hypothetical protein
MTMISTDHFVEQPVWVKSGTQCYLHSVDARVPFARGKAHSMMPASRLLVRFRRFSDRVRGRSSDDDSTIIGDILSQLHIEAAPVLEAARAETNDAALRTQTGEAKQLGLFGAPTFATADGGLFWGNDRLGRAIAWARMGFGPIATD